MPRVLAAMSGGVDSSVAAFLLKKKGFDVIGVTMKLSPPCHTLPETDRYIACCSEDSIAEAKKVAQKIGIRHYVLNLREIFEKTVIENFYREYKRGRTPNPCIRCNQFIKFDALLKKAKQLNADYICTGHYAKIQYNETQKKFFLKRARDKTKDQSYVLYVLSQKQLKHIFFPLGDLTKEEVRKIAKKANFSNCARRESQELCFVAQKDYRKFINKFLKPKTGEIMDASGRVLGEHKGIFYYTIGQRKGLGLNAKRPYYVIAIDWRRNRIVVGFEEELYSRSLIANDINFISIDKLTRPLKVKAKIRYKHFAQEAVISKVNKIKVKVEFLKPQRAITPGQAVVFYQKDVVLGGGTIE